MKRLLVTGAGGFVGTNLCKQLTSEGHMVRAVVRREGGPAIDTAESMILGDISHSRELDAALAGVDTVVHLAARVHIMKPSANDNQQFHQVNVMGTERLAKAAAANGVKRFIFLSSIKVNGEATSGKAFGNNDAPKPSDEYGVSKWRAEQALFDVAAKSKLDVVAIRPPLVYGPGVKANFLRLLAWVNKGVPLPFGAIHNKRSLISVWNLCDLINRAVEVPSTKTGVLMASDGEDLSTPDLIRSLSRSMNRPARLFAVPIGVLRAAGAITGKSAEISRLSDSLQIDLSDTCKQLDWQPPVSVHEGLRRTVTWYLNEAPFRGR